MKPFYVYNVYDIHKENILFLHGFLEHSKTWEPYLQELSKDYNCLLYDFPGHGNNLDYPVNDISFEKISINIISELNTFHVNKTHIVCHSMGGYFGGFLKLKYPQYIQKVILSNTLLNADTKTQLNKRVKTKRVLKTNLQLLCKLSFSHLENTYKKDKEAHCISCTPDHLIQLQTVLSNRKDLTFLLDEYPKDFHFIFGENDTHIPWRDSGNKTKKRQHILPKEGHTLPLKSKSEWIGIILQALK